MLYLFYKVKELHPDHSRCANITIDLSYSLISSGGGGEVMPGLGEPKQETTPCRRSLRRLRRNLLVC